MFGDRWSVRVTEEDRDRARQLLKDQLRQGAISYEVFEAKSVGISRARFVADLFALLSENPKKARRRGLAKVLRPSIFNVLTVFFAFTLMIGVWGDVWIGVGLMSAMILGSLCSSIAIAVRRRRAGSVRVDPSSLH
jgi:hypothetical protein